MSLSIVIPCFNSQKYILENIKKLRKYIKKLNYRYEIILVDDCSSDNTYKIIKKLSQKYKNIKILQNNLNRGKSYSLIRGIKKSNFKKIIIIDSDFPYFNRLAITIKRLNNYDFVLINREHKKSRNIEENNFYQLMRTIIGKIVNFIVRYSFSINIRDTQAGLKGFIKPQDFSKLKFSSKRFFFDLELLLYFISKKKKFFQFQFFSKYQTNQTLIFSI